MNASILSRFCKKFGINAHELEKLEPEKETKLITGSFFYEVKEYRNKVSIANWTAWRFKPAQPESEEVRSNFHAGIREFIDAMSEEFGLKHILAPDSSNLETYEIDAMVRLSIQYDSPEKNGINWVEISIWDEGI